MFLQEQCSKLSNIKPGTFSLAFALLKKACPRYYRFSNLIFMELYWLQFIMTRPAVSHFIGSRLSSESRIFSLASDRVLFLSLLLSPRRRSRNNPPKMLPFGCVSRMAPRLDRLWPIDPSFSPAQLCPSAAGRPIMRRCVHFVMTVMKF